MPARRALHTLALGFDIAVVLWRQYSDRFSRGWAFGSDAAPAGFRGSRPARTACSRIRGRTRYAWRTLNVARPRAVMSDSQLSTSATFRARIEVVPHRGSMWQRINDS